MVSHLYKTKTNTRFLKKIQDLSKKRELTALTKTQLNEQRITGRHTSEICGTSLIKQADAYHVNAHPRPMNVTGIIDIS